MEKIRKLFGGIDLSWKKVIIWAIAAGAYTAIMAMLPIARNTSFADLTVSFEVWILFGIIIIMNSRSPVDSALKCVVFFLISQPLVYLIQDLINQSSLFITYYRYWFMWTVATVPMGFIGHYMKKDKWWGLLILTPILILLGDQFSGYLSKTMFSFPRHLLTTVFCIITLIIYPLCIFKNKINKILGTAVSGLIITVMTVLCLVNPPVYSTDILSDGEEYNFDGTYSVYLTDESYGELNIRYEEAIESYMVHAEFKKAGKTEFVLESPNGEKTTFDIEIERDTFDVVKK
ncbi:MAG: hypothetical protein K6F76_04815 [Clostridiales bacterium]|nr:hypothetical protein [Clostridiales bacterium]